MASIISAGTTSGTSLNLSGDTSGVLQLASNGSTTAVTIDTSQNIGIGTTTPTGKFEVKSANNTGTDSIIRATSNNGTASTWLTFNGVSVSSGNACVFHNGTTEQMRIDSSGNVAINSTGGIGRIDVRGAGASGIVGYFAQTAAGGWVTQKVAQVNGGQYYFTQFLAPTSQVGSIESNGSTTTYGTSSDYRLKENIAPMTGALAKVTQLKPVTYKWKNTGIEDNGFIAHELQEILPNAVTGKKDAVETYTDEDGNEQTRPKYQGVDTSFLVATLTAAIQELNAKVEAQAVRIAELEGAR